jgi:hypothetical protein
MVDLPVIVEEHRIRGAVTYRLPGVGPIFSR